MTTKPARARKTLSGKTRERVNGAAKNFVKNEKDKRISVAEVEERERKR